MFCRRIVVQLSTILSLAALSACEVPDLSGASGSVAESAALEDALEGEWAADPMELDDPAAVLAAVNSTTLLDTWRQLDDEMLALAQDLSLAQGAESCVTYTEDLDAGTVSAAGRCESEIDGADFLGSISVTSTATGAYQSQWDDLVGRDEGLSVTGDGLVSTQEDTELIQLAVSRGWTSSSTSAAGAHFALEAEGALGAQGQIYAGQLVVEDSTEIPSGAMRFAITSYPELGSRRQVMHTMVQADRRWELIRYDEDGAEACHILKEDGAEVENTCGA